MQIETVDKETLDLIQRLMADEKLSNFNLVGGTALALLIGHRKSVDIDLFCPTDFDSKELGQHLIDNYATDRVAVKQNGVFAIIEKVKVDILTHKYPLLDPIEVRAGIRMVSLKEIGAMKLNAMYGNGTRLKDFIDIYVLLERYPLKVLLDHAAAKYPDLNPFITKQSVIHHHDIDFANGVEFVGKEVSWTTIATRLKEAFLYPNKIFSGRKTLKNEPKDRNNEQKDAPNPTKR